MLNPLAKYNVQPGPLFLLMLFLWFLLNVVQSLFMEIGNDEAYYWVYAQFLDWGYYDHPPMVALVIKMGTLLAGDTTLGVRFCVMLMQLFFLIILFRLSRVAHTRPNIILFFLVAFSVVMIQAYGFIATPDAPLLLFTALFLWSYHYFLETAYSLKGALLMAFCMAGLMYSKYHGALVIVLVLLSNLKLLRKPTFYLSVLLAVSLYIPHILWQLNNDFPSIKYHLVERSKGFRWNYFPDFLANQLPVFNPFTLGAGIYVFFRRKETDLFERALKFLFAGFLIFFTLWNFKGRVEPHWTIAAAVPMIILIVREAAGSPKLRNYLYKVVAPSIVLLLAARLFLMVDILPVRTEWHGDKQRVADLEAIAGNRPVIFTSGFQMPSKYRFYTGREAHAMGALNYRNTQYDIWRFDENYLGKPVVIDFRNDSTGVVPTRRGNSVFCLKEIAAYQPYKLLKVVPILPESTFIIGREQVVTVTVSNPYPETYVINHSAMPLEVSLVFMVKRNEGFTREKISTRSSFNRQEIASGEHVTGEISFFLPDMPPGEYSVYFAVGSPGIYPATIERPVKIFFKDDSITQ